MQRFHSRSRTPITLVVLAAFSAQSVVPAQAATPIRMGDWAGGIDLSSSRMSPFSLEGSASRLGRFQAYGEVRFTAGAMRGSLVGRGVAVFQTEDGKYLAGNVTWDVAPGGDLRASQLRIDWTDKIRLSDGTVVVTDRDFDNDKPEALVVIAIIAILIGLLLPAVQK